MTTAALRAWRECMGYTQQQAAQALGVSLRTVKAWEAGFAAPPAGVRACALVSQAAFDASMTRGWYVDAARLLRQCGRVMAARSAESKARRARKGVFD